MNCLERVQSFGLSESAASAVLHQLADHLAGKVAPDDKGCELFQTSFRAGVRNACDELRREAGDIVTTAPLNIPHPKPCPES